MAQGVDRKTVDPTEGETKLFISIMKNLESDIVFNAEAVAKECGYKSAKVVKDRWSQVKKNKLGLMAATTTPDKSSTPAKKRKGGEEIRGGADDEEEVGSPTPTKKSRTPKAKANKAESAVKEELKDGADEEVVGSPPPAKKARAEKGKVKVKKQATAEEEPTGQEEPVVKE